MSGKRQSFLANSLKKMTLTIFLSVHWGAPQEQTSARITEPLCKHHQSLSLVWMILNSKCDHCRESWYSEEELNAHIESVHKDPTTSPGWSLPWIEISWEWKDLWKGRATDCIVIAMIILLEKIRVANIATVAKTLFNLCKESQLWTDFSQEEERRGAKRK